MRDEQVVNTGCQIVTAQQRHCDRMASIITHNPSRTLIVFSQSPSSRRSVCLALHVER